MLASALALGVVPLVAAAPAMPALADVRIGFNYFHDQLRNSGDWYYSDRWGEVWQPAFVGSSWRPYKRGYWVNTDDYGWYWVSYEDFGDITDHYGRWVNDPDDGWLWIPGYVWSPAWVVWRQSGNYVGWMPMPPDSRFLAGDDFGGNGSFFGITIGNVTIGFNNWNNVGDYYGYSRWYGRDYSPNRFNAMWTFVPAQHMGDRDFRRYELPLRSIGKVIRTSTNTTNYAVVNNHIVNRGIVPGKGGVPKFQPVRARDVIRQPALIVPLDQGRQIQSRMRAEAPRGNGEANSTPKPTVTQLQTLSLSDGSNGRGRKHKHLLDRNAAAQQAGVPAATVNRTPDTTPSNDKMPENKHNAVRDGMRDNNGPRGGATESLKGTAPANMPKPETPPTRSMPGTPSSTPPTPGSQSGAAATENGNGERKDRRERKNHVDTSPESPNPAANTAPTNTPPVSGPNTTGNGASGDDRGTVKRKHPDRTPDGAPAMSAPPAGNPPPAPGSNTTGNDASGEDQGAAKRKHRNQMPENAPPATAPAATAPASPGPSAPAASNSGASTDDTANTDSNAQKRRKKHPGTSGDSTPQ